MWFGVILGHIRGPEPVFFFNQMLVDLDLEGLDAFERRVILQRRK